MAAGHFNGTVVGELLAECDIGAGEAPHVLLAVLWASMVTAPEGPLDPVITLCCRMLALWSRHTNGSA